MKAHLAKLSLALLSTVFLLGCQDMGSGPLGPEGPQFDKPSESSCPVARDKGHCHVDDGPTEDATYTATFAGDVKSLGINENGTFTPGPIRLHAKLSTGVHVLAVLDLSFFRDNEDVLDGAKCFADGAFTLNDGTSVANATGPMGFDVKKNDPNNVWMLFGFNALGTDGTVVNYGLFLFGVITKGNLPPAETDETTTITWKTFDMHHSNGPGKKVACEGTGSFDDPKPFAEVTRN